MFRFTILILNALISLTIHEEIFEVFVCCCLCKWERVHVVLYQDPTIPMPCAFRVMVLHLLE